MSARRSPLDREPLGVAGSACLTDGRVQIDSNWIKNQIRSIALERKNGLFAGLLCSGKRVGVIMSLIQSARLNVRLRTLHVWGCGESLYCHGIHRQTYLDTPVHDRLVAWMQREPLSNTGLTFQHR